MNPIPKESALHSPVDVNRLDDTLVRLRDRIATSVVGREDVVELCLVALLADGHVLLEDYPGSGKTILAKSIGFAIGDLPAGRLPMVGTAQSNQLGRSVGADQWASFSRMQFTPDMLPSDVIGVSVFDTKTEDFRFVPGPIFSRLVLVDEINRSSPKVQAALLEAMAERQVTVDSVTYALPDVFFVIATQNPYDQVGTFPLPAAQLDRFLFKLKMGSLSREQEAEVLARWGKPRQIPTEAVVSHRDILDIRGWINEQGHFHSIVSSALLDIAQNLRDDERCQQGLSTRALVQAVPALKALAFLRGRSFVSGADLAYLAPLIAWHRIVVQGSDSLVSSVIADAVGPAIETLSQQTLRA